jgi:hypothetical protein
MGKGKKIKPTKIWKKKNNGNKIKIEKETNKYSPREKIYKRNKK